MFGFPLKSTFLVTFIAYVALICCENVTEEMKIKIVIRKALIG
jgi:hypothetical protein